MNKNIPPPAVSLRKRRGKQPLKIICIFIALVFGILNNACNNKPPKLAQLKIAAIDSLVPKYSHSFRVDYYQGYKVLRVFSVKDKKTLTTYLLSDQRPQGGSDTSAGPEGYSDAVRICYPSDRVVCMSTTHVGAMKLLDARNLIAASANKALICDSIVSAMIAGGAIKDIGQDFQPDYEAIAMVKPDLLFSDGESAGSSQMFAKLKALGVKVVCSRDYFEQEPLARAEWIKFFAAFIGKEKLADSIFKAVENDYIQLNREWENTPTVFCNLPYSGVWYMPCGQNYVARLITDAGGNFLWNKEKPMNGLNLTLNFEQVYQRAANADFWINTGTFTDLKQIAAADAKFKLFKAYKTGNVFNATKRLSPGGGMDIWETGTFMPNIVVRDLAIILHSHTRSPGDLYFYKQLR